MSEEPGTSTQALEPVSRAGNLASSLPIFFFFLLVAVAVWLIDRRLGALSEAERRALPAPAALAWALNSVLTRATFLFPPAIFLAGWAFFGWGCRNPGRRLRFAWSFWLLCVLVTLLCAAALLWPGA
ncbi:MAG: hypothetical protein M5U26_18600 [Planctomycetota bacterium]|nr:hypothetical protein [Planctomycetota bacterium]